MLLESLSELRGLAIFGLLAALIFSQLLKNKYGNGVHHIPGPLLASFTDYWRLFVVWGRRPEATHIKLHEKYGDLVRIGPKTVLVAEWEATKRIYALNAGYVKVHFRFLSSSLLSELTPAQLVWFLPCSAEHRERKAIAQSFQL